LPRSDLDGTLYAIENGYEKACRDRVFDFMVAELGVAPDAASAEAMWRKEFQIHNQTLRALRHGLGIEVDAAKYWAFTRGDPGELLRPNLDALAVLRSVRKGVRKIVLTNCAEKQAREALRVLGIEDEFAAVYGADAMGETCKPMREAFERIWAMDPCGVDPSRCAFFEDSVKNLASAKEHFGTFTVQIAGKTAEEEGSRSDGFVADAIISAVTVDEVRRVLPGLWEE
jgi:putative hydrolase of the HAD superfamily